MTTIVADIRQAAKASPAASIDWPDRGHAPRGYVEGMAVAFARVLCKHAQGDPAVLEMATARRPDPSRDALAHYDDLFVQNGMDNSQAGRDTLRHLFVLLVGLGMRESSGQHCEGRDMSADNVTAETAEAGLFQASWNVRSGHELLVPLFTTYRAHPSGFIEIFRQGVTCSAESWRNWGEGEGVAFQKLSKECPAFAAEFSALGLRWKRRNWGPINTRKAGIRVEWDQLFLKVQQMVDATAGACVDLV